MLGDLYDEVGEFASQIFPNKKQFIGRHVMMRNGVAHRNPDAMIIDHTQLFYHTNGVIVLCHATAMKKIGISESKIVELMRDSRFRVFLIEKAASLYPV